MNSVNSVIIAISAAAILVVAAAIWVTEYRARRLEAKQHQKDLQTWEDESGHPGPTPVPGDSSDQ